jgi:hypothetical protein
MHSVTVAQAFGDLHREAERLVGGLGDLPRRAAVYRHIYHAAGGLHAFPLIAAHGALWSGSHFRWGLRLGRWLLCSRFGQQRRAALQHSVEEFANVFRDINRRVCIDTYVNFHLTRRFRDDPELARFVAPTLLSALTHLHAATDSGAELDTATRREIFSAHFLYEQQHVVGPRLQEALSHFDWPLMRFIALRPAVRFAYFPSGRSLRFRDFSVREERIAMGLRAFEIAAQVGWSAVDAALDDYETHPAVLAERLGEMWTAAARPVPSFPGLPSVS